ncbi:MAG: peptidoglycan DD-metalloendopeptidase family protein, partial [Muribaculaceae bacterium]|nr:peptidoglycan DD-metalloendopeptidase family protein [Muribaculaceae bacterium]
RKKAEAEAEKARREQAEADRKAREAREKAEKQKTKGVPHRRRDTDTKTSDVPAPSVRHRPSGSTANAPVPPKPKPRTSSGSTAAPGGAAAPKLPSHNAGGESGVASASTGTYGANFAESKGLLPMPVIGRYTIVKRFGRQQHPTLKHVETNNAGIDMQTAPGASVRSVYDGEVSAIFKPDGYNTVVVIRHGNYLTVYANLGIINVKTGQKVKGGQTIGQVFSDPDDSGRSVLHFEIRNGRSKENPELWLKR